MANETRQADRAAQRRERRERAERRYLALEQARRQRRGNVRRTLREGALHPSITSRRTLLVVLGCVIVLGVALTLHHSGRGGPALTTSCTTPGIALSSAATASGNGISYSITGPSAGTYVVAVDATTVTVRGDGVIATPKGAFGASIHQGLKGCATVGTLPALAAGPHTVLLFRDGQEVARATLGG